MLGGAKRASFGALHSMSAKPVGLIHVKQFVARKKTWRTAQAKLSFAKKAVIVETLRDNAATFRKLRKLRQTA